MAGVALSRLLKLFILLTFIIMMMTMVNEVKVVFGDELSPSQCDEEQQLGVNACRPIVSGFSPSPACCERVRVSHFECICPAVTPKIAALVNVKKATKLLQSCGRNVPSHFKCGSLYFP